MSEHFICANGYCADLMGFIMRLLVHSLCLVTCRVLTHCVEHVRRTVVKLRTPEKGDVQDSR